MVQPRTRSVAAALAAALLFCLPALGAAASRPGAVPQEGGAAGRVVVLGIDGMDARLAAQWMDEGRLPNLARLREEGTFARLMPGNPAQSPVSWATLNTGRNPGKHAIFDFIRNRRPDVAPDYGFQERASVPVASTPLAARRAVWPWLFLGGGLVLAAILFFLLRGSIPVAVAAAVLVLAGSGYAAWSLLSSFPREGFQDWRSLCKAEEFWYTLDRAGVPFRGQGVVVDYPASELRHGKLLCGLGAPDARGSYQSWAIYTTHPQRVRPLQSYPAAPAYTAEDAPAAAVESGRQAGSGKVYRLVESTPGTWVSKLYGPVNLVQRERLERALEAARAGDEWEEVDRIQALLNNAELLNTWVPLEVRWRSGDPAAEVVLDGRSQRVRMRSWSDFFPVSFEWSPWLSTCGLARVWVEPDGDGLELFAAPVQIDPHHPTPGSRICWPAGYAGALADAIGDYETLGWACENMSRKDGELSEEAFVSDIEFTETWRRDMLREVAAARDWRVLFHFFGGPDRMAHMTMHHSDPHHPLHDAAAAQREFQFFGQPVAAKDLVRAVYEELDEVVGWLLEEVLGPDDVLLIVSDHGFDSFRRQVNLNNWLAEQGYLAVEETARSTRFLSEYADWSATRAYSMGLGKIYLAREGREKYGIVRDEEADALLREITEKLFELADPDTGEKIVRRVYRREEIYSGDWWQERRSKDPSQRWLEGAPELTIDFAPGYRVSWNCTAGGLGRRTDPETGALGLGPAVYDNDRPWTGDHCGVDLALVQGVFFSNRRFELPPGDDHFDATHLAPTVLRLVGVPAPVDYDRQPLVLR